MGECDADDPRKRGFTLVDERRAAAENTVVVKGIKRVSNNLGVECFLDKLEVALWNFAMLVEKWLYILDAL